MSNDYSHTSRGVRYQTREKLGSEIPPYGLAHELLS